MKAIAALTLFAVALVTRAAVGKSLREANERGPDIRVYLGIKWEFGPFPRNKE
jgi:hypothetical protein